jgi:hypothetical protein
MTDSTVPEVSPAPDEGDRHVFDLSDEMPSASPNIQVTEVEDTTKNSPVPGPPPDLHTINIEEEREKKRGQIALLLVRLLVGLAAATMLLVALRNLLGFTLSELKDILIVLIPPVVALVGTVSGFYFGGRAERP